MSAQTQQALTLAVEGVADEVEVETVLDDLRLRHFVEYETWPVDVPAAGEQHRALGSAAFRNLPPEDIGPEPGQGSGVGAVNGDCEQRVVHGWHYLSRVAVGGEDRTGDVAGLGRGEEGDNRGDLAGLGGAGEQGRGTEGLYAFGRGPAVSTGPAATDRALPPSAVMVSTTAEPRAVSRPCTTTSAPCRPSSSAAARPMPELAPVTRAPMPSRSRC